MFKTASLFCTSYGTIHHMYITYIHIYICIHHLNSLGAIFRSYQGFAVPSANKSETCRKFPDAFNHWRNSAETAASNSLLPPFLLPSWCTIIRIFSTAATWYTQDTGQPTHRYQNKQQARKVWKQRAHEWGQRTRATKGQQKSFL